MGETDSRRVFDAILPVLRGLRPSEWVEPPTQAFAL